MTLLMAGAVAAAPREAGPSPPATSAEQRAQRARQQAIGRLTKAFRSAHKSPEKRAAAIQELLRMGPVGAAALRELVQAEMAPVVVQYFEQVAHKTVEMTAKREVDADRVAERRRVIGNLRSDKNLTKERIVSEGDASLKQLREMLEPRVDEMIARNEDLVKLRNTIAHAYLIVAACERVSAGSPEGPAPATLEEEMPAEPDESPELEPLNCAMADDDAARPTLLRLTAIEMDAVSATIAGTAAAQTTLEANARLAGMLDAAEANAAAKMNRIRVLIGQPPMKIDLKLAQCARGHSTDMVKQHFFSHISPVPKKRTYSDRAKLAGAEASAENIYFGTADPEGPLESWWHSPPHFKNMLSGAARMGLGRYEDHWTLNTGRK